VKADREQARGHLVQRSFSHPDPDQARSPSYYTIRLDAPNYT
jgi:hypothetical protein